MVLVVGLGNPGAQYRDSRHNLGFMVVDELGRRAGAGSPRAKLGAELADAKLDGVATLLCKPQEYMNVSGESVAQVARFFKIPPADVLVIHDELDLPFSRLKLAAGGGPGGHNGVRSIIERLGTNDFPRLRVGIGRPPAPMDPAAYVLQDFDPAEAHALPALLATAADAATAVVTGGLASAMNKFNIRKSGDTA